MVIFTRTYDLLKWLLPKIERFPKLYRSTVTQRLVGSALDFQEALFDAQAYTGNIRLRHLILSQAASCKPWPAGINWKQPPLARCCPVPDPAAGCCSRRVRKPCGKRPY
jgi:hypothetical protein